MLSTINSLQRRKISHGVITITMSLLLLALASIGALYTAKTKLFDIRITNSEVRKNQAVINAEAGLQRAIAQLDMTPKSRDTIAEPAGDNDYSVAIADAIDPATGDLYALPIGHAIVTITSTGFSDDDTGTRILEQKVRIRPPTQGAPDAPITVAGGMGIGGSFTVGANPNGGGLGVPLSVWSDTDVTLTGNGATCGLEEFDNGVCQTFPYSDNTSEGNDLLEGANFPDDVFEYTFGEPASEYRNIKDKADSIIANCDSLNAASTGLIWVEGACTINANTTVGSTEKPVVLVIEDANLTMNGGAEIYGLVFSFQTPGGTAGTISMTGGAVIRGAFIADHPINIPAGTFDTRYDSAVLENIQDPDGDVFSIVDPIPGSWKDF